MQLRDVGSEFGAGSVLHVRRGDLGAYTWERMFVVLIRQEKPVSKYYAFRHISDSRGVRAKIKQESVPQIDHTIRHAGCCREEELPGVV